MKFCSVEGNLQPASDFLVGKAIRHRSWDCSFAIGQSPRKKAYSDPSVYLRLSAEDYRAAINPRVRRGPIRAGARMLHPLFMISVAKFQWWQGRAA